MLPAAARRRPRGDPDLTAVLLLYALTLFASATLLFLMQPMVGKMILPLLGGTPAVWSTCMVFFQAALLGGYAYAHASTARLRLSRQVILHLVVLALPFVVLPLAVNPRLLRGEANPVLDVHAALGLGQGCPSGGERERRCSRSGSRRPVTRPRATRTSSTRRAISAACWRLAGLSDPGRAAPALQGQGCSPRPRSGPWLRRVAVPTCPLR
jgi:hypothetical protein